MENKSKEIVPQQVSYAKKYGFNALLFCLAVSVAGGLRTKLHTGQNLFGDAISGLLLGLIGTPIIAIYIALPAYLIGWLKDRRLRRKQQQADATSHTNSRHP